MSSALTAGLSALGFVGSLLINGGKMYTTLSITINGDDVSHLFPPISFIHMRYDDEISFKADNFELICPDIGDQLINSTYIKKGVSLKAAITQYNRYYPGSITRQNIGGFQVDQIEQTGPPTQLILLATSCPIGATLKATIQNRVIPNAITLQALGKFVADENQLGYKWQVTSFQRNKIINTASQRDETDLQMLAHMCKEEALGMKIAGDPKNNNKPTLFIFDEQALEMQPPVFTVDMKQTGAMGIISWHFDTRSQDIYSRAEVGWIDPDTGTDVSGEWNGTETAANSGSKEVLRDFSIPVFPSSNTPDVDIG